MAYSISMWNSIHSIPSYHAIQSQLRPGNLNFPRSITTVYIAYKYNVSLDI